MYVCSYLATTMHHVHAHFYKPRIRSQIFWDGEYVRFSVITIIMITSMYINDYTADAPQFGSRVPQMKRDLEAANDAAVVSHCATRVCSFPHGGS